MIEWRTHLPLSSLLFDIYFGIDSPIKALAFFVALDEGIMLAEVVTHTGLPSAGRCFELIPRVLLFNVIVDLLKVHLASAG